MIILAIDPGFDRNGYAIIDKRKRENKIVKYGCIMTEKGEAIEKRIGSMCNEISEIIEEYNPKVIVIEKVFFHKNQKTIIQVAQAQGALLSEAYKRKLPIEFLTPLEVKQAITGYGRADKLQIQKMLKILLNLKTLPKPDDISDAIAVGIAFCCIRRFE